MDEGGRSEKVFFALCAALVVYEVVTLFVTKDPDDHITAIVKRLNQNPVVPFAAGFVSGHLFW